MHRSHSANLLDNTTPAKSRRSLLERSYNAADHNLHIKRLTFSAQTLRPQKKQTHLKKFLSFNCFSITDFGAVQMGRTGVFTGPILAPSPYV